MTKILESEWTDEKQKEQVSFDLDARSTGINVLTHRSSRQVCVQRFVPPLKRRLTISFAFKSTSKVTKDDLEPFFRKWGSIEGLTLQRYGCKHGHYTGHVVFKSRSPKPRFSKESLWTSGYSLARGPYPWDELEWMDIQSFLQDQLDPMDRLEPLL